MNFKHWLLQEQFDTVSDFILNPQHRNKTWGQLESEFRADGGEILGAGKYGTVFNHPKWNYVLKLYDDELYTRFVRYAYKNPFPSFPKFFGPPQRVLPFYKRSRAETELYLVRMEKLEPITNSEWDVIFKNYQNGISYLDVLQSGQLDREEDEWIKNSPEAIKAGKPRYVQAKVKINQKFYQQVIDAIKNNPKLLTLFEGLRMLQRSGMPGVLDMHKDNIMKRANGDFVIIDPFWHGSNPYQDYDAVRRAETDSYPDYDEPELFPGGKFPPSKARQLARKRKSQEKQRLRLQASYDDTPF